MARLVCSEGQGWQGIQSQLQLAQPGDEVVLEPGVYKGAETLTVPTGVNLLGAPCSAFSGSGSEHQPAIQQTAKPTTQLLFTAALGPAVKLANTSDNRIADLAIEWRPSRTARSAILELAKAALAESTPENPSSENQNLAETSLIYADLCHNILIEGCFVVGINPTASTSPKGDREQAPRPFTGIRLNDCNNSKVKGVWVMKFQVGISFFRSQGSILNNHCHHNVASILLIGKGTNSTDAANTNNQVHGNECWKNTLVGIQLQEGAQGHLTGNRCHHNPAGIVLSSEDADGANTLGLLNSNECWDNKLTGIALQQGAHGYLTGNRCHHNEKIGILLSDKGTDGQLDGNECWDNTLAGIALRRGAGAHSNLIGNRCHHNEAGILLDSQNTLGQVNGNECWKNKNAGILLQQGAQGHLTDNRCHHNEDGILLTGEGTYGHLVGNECWDNSNSNNIFRDLGVRPEQARVDSHHLSCQLGPVEFEQWHLAPIHSRHTEHNLISAYLLAIGQICLQGLIHSLYSPGCHKCFQRFWLPEDELFELEKKADQSSADAASTASSPAEPRLKRYGLPSGFSGDQPIRELAIRELAIKSLDGTQDKTTAKTTGQIKDKTSSAPNNRAMPVRLIRSEQTQLTAWQTRLYEHMKGWFATGRTDVVMNVGWISETTDSLDQWLDTFNQLSRSTAERSTTQFREGVAIQHRDQVGTDQSAAFAGLVTAIQNDNGQVAKPLILEAAELDADRDGQEFIDERLKATGNPHWERFWLWLSSPFVVLFSILTPLVLLSAWYPETLLNQAPDAVWPLLRQAPAWLGQTPAWLPYTLIPLLGLLLHCQLPQALQWSITWPTNLGRSLLKLEAMADFLVDLVSKVLPSQWLMKTLRYHQRRQWLRWLKQRLLSPRNALVVICVREQDQWRKQDLDALMDLVTERKRYGSLVLVTHMSDEMALCSGYLNLAERLDGILPPDRIEHELVIQEEGVETGSALASSESSLSYSTTVSGSSFSYSTVFPSSLSQSGVSQASLSQSDIDSARKVLGWHQLTEPEYERAFSSIADGQWSFNAAMLALIVGSTRIQAMTLDCKVSDSPGQWLQPFQDHIRPWQQLFNATALPLPTEQEIKTALDRARVGKGYLFVKQRPAPGRAAFDRVHGRSGQKSIIKRYLAHTQGQEDSQYLIYLLFIGEFFHLKKAVSQLAAVVNRTDAQQAPSMSHGLRESHFHLQAAAQLYSERMGLNSFGSDNRLSEEQTALVEEQREQLSLLVRQESIITPEPSDKLEDALLNLYLSALHYQHTTEPKDAQQSVSKDWTQKLESWQHSTTSATDQNPTSVESLCLKQLRMQRDKLCQLDPVLANELLSLLRQQFWPGDTAVANQLTDWFEYGIQQDAVPLYGQLLQASNRQSLEASFSNHLSTPATLAMHLLLAFDVCRNPDSANPERLQQEIQLAELLIALRSHARLHGIQPLVDQFAVREPRYCQPPENSAGTEPGAVEPGAVLMSLLKDQQTLAPMLRLIENYRHKPILVIEGLSLGNYSQINDEIDDIVEVELLGAL